MDVKTISTDSMVVFASSEGRPAFELYHCDEANLSFTVALRMFGEAPELSEDQVNEVAAVVAGLRAKKYADFEDGWIALAVGLSEVTTFLFKKVCDAEEEAQFAQDQRFQAHLQANQMKVKYQTLCEALTDALRSHAAPLIAVLNEDRQIGETGDVR